jgi:hypothetical protein
MADRLFYTGKGPDGKPANQFPMPVTTSPLLRGEQRYNIYCAPCHDRTGSGDGMIVRAVPPSPHSTATACDNSLMAISST